MSQADARDALIRRLRLAYSGELAAAVAYAGHWRTLRDPDQRANVQRIRAEELAHRARVGEMLAELGARPHRLRDALMALVGLAIAISCFVGGWTVPMVGAGRIERVNIREYEDAARRAVAAGLPEYAEEFLHMAEVEWDHERYFHDLVRARPGWLARRADWPDPLPREEIRASFHRDLPHALTPPRAPALAPA